jgi:holliday junction DNA helicase RuvA
VISRIRGTLLGHDGQVVEVATPGGVVYQIEVPLSVVERLPRPESEVELRTVQIVREDQMALFGFLSPGERELFLRVIGVSGVGARLGLALLSAYSASRLARALSERDVAALVQVSGVGKKTAERLVLELSDRMEGIEMDVTEGVGEGRGSQAIRALVALGMAFTDADKAVSSVLSEGGDVQTDEIVRQVLARR